MMPFFPSSLLLMLPDSWGRGRGGSALYVEIVRTSTSTAAHQRAYHTTELRSVAVRGTGERGFFGVSLWGRGDGYYYA
jgi:hypothetical protein